MDSYESLNAASLAETIREEFKDADRPVTIRDVADLYGLVAAQHEATLAVYALAMKANPGIIFTDEATGRFRLRTTEALKSSGGGGTFDGMEPRVAKLEAMAEHMTADVGQLKADMRDVRDRAAVIDVKVDHLPGKGFIVASVVISLAIVAALVGFAQNIQAMLQ